MQAINRVAVLGLGALGAVYAAKFLENTDCEVLTVAAGGRYERLKNHGFTLNGKSYRLPVVRPDEPVAPADLIIVALKHHHLAEATGYLTHLVGEQTTIISVMNGLDSEVILGRRYGMDKLLYCVAVGIDAVREESCVNNTKTGRLVFGEATNTTPPSPKVQRVQTALERAGIACEVPVDMMRMLWWKFMVNVGVNQASAVMRARYGYFHTSPNGQALMEALMREVIALAPQEGVNLSEQDLVDWYPVLHTLSARGKTSMLQDIEAGRKSEVEVFAGKVVELGMKHHMPTPANLIILQIIKGLEENYSVATQLTPSTGDF